MLYVFKNYRKTIAYFHNQILLEATDFSFIRQLCYSNIEVASDETIGSLSMKVFPVIAYCNNENIRYKFHG